MPNEDRFQAIAEDIKSRLNSKFGEFDQRIASIESTTQALRTGFDQFAMAADIPGDPVQENDTPGARLCRTEDLDQRLAGIRQTAGRVSVNLGQLIKPLPEMTTITSDTVGSSTAGILTPQRVRDYVPAARRRLTIRDLLPVRQVDSNAVEYPKENAFTNAASPQTEGSDKAESALTFTIETANVRTLAHWIPVSVQVLDDWTQLQRIINSQMVYGLKLIEETEILSGSGSGQHLNGLITQAGSYAGTHAVAGDTKLDTIRHALLELEAVDEEPDFIVLHPEDFHDIQLVKDQASNVGNYVAADPLGGAMNVPTLWNRAVIVSNSMTNGDFLVGNSRQAEIFDRMAATVVLSTEHSDYFIKNLVAIRAEERLALAVYRTSAFLTGTF